MNLLEITKEAKSLYHPVFLLEDYISHLWRRKLELGFLILFIIGLVFSLTTYIFVFFEIELPYISHHSIVRGVTGLFFLLWIKFFLLEAFYYSYYFSKTSKNKFFIDFDLAKAVYDLGSNPVEDFFKTKVGKMVLLRAGIGLEDFSTFIKNKKSNITDFNFEIKENKLTLSDFVLTLVKEDKELSQFFLKYGVGNKELRGICEWIGELEYSKVDARRWWSRESLSRTKSIGRDWSYGQIYTLKKYEKELVSGLSLNYRIHSSYGVKELNDLETTLSKSRDANVLLVGDDEAGKLQIVGNFKKIIDEGDSVGSLHHKRVVLFDNDIFVAENGNKQAFEENFIKVITEAISSGNIILVIEDLPGFINSASTLGVDLPGLMESYLTSPDLQIIALSTVDEYHRIIEKNAILNQHFESVLIKDIDDLNTIKVLQNEIVSLERSGLFFTFNSLEAIVEGAERYFSSGIMPDKAIDLLSELTPKLLSKGKSLVERSDVLSLIEEKTGIPVSGVTGVEKDKLLNLETLLHKRIVGQDEAVKTISNAVRRARSGITNPSRPLGSFLFLGPTGVGKTETTKALADIFFGDKAEILRLDMSEYSSFDAVSKLIGSFETKQPGVLVTMVREHQYGVLLLDEFEKTTKEVMNIFLQALDEGFVSDSSGKKVMMRNLIIIATSNAGSDMIWNAMQEGKDLSKEKDNIVDSIIKSGTFKPELLNRFDGVVLFHPLEDSHLKDIAKIQLNKLHDRLVEQGIDLVINDDLVNFVMKFGVDPKFGARPMNRAIQEKVEEIIAKKIIDGSIAKGTPVTLTSSELN